MALPLGRLKDLSGGGWLGGLFGSKPTKWVHVSSAPGVFTLQRWRLCRALLVRPATS